MGVARDPADADDATLVPSHETLVAARKALLEIRTWHLVVEAEILVDLAGRSVEKGAATPGVIAGIGSSSRRSSRRKRP